MDPHIDAFLRYNYGELKDLTKVGLALSSASFAFYVAYAEKVVETSRATIGVRRIMNVAFWLLICAVGCCLGAFAHEQWGLMTLDLAWAPPEALLARLPAAALHMRNAAAILIIGALSYLAGLFLILVAARHVAETSGAVVESKSDPVG
ncbi:MAG: hypothetical protein ACRYFY_01620 [Janthinobacterium lividum]